MMKSPLPTPPSPNVLMKNLPFPILPLLPLLLGLLAAAPALAQEGAWGKIANPAYQGRPPVAALFFAGPPPSAALYTRHPKNASKLDWSNDADIDFALDQMNAVGLNTIKLSYWG